MRPLTDAELVQFLDESYLVLELDDVSEATHDALFEEAQASYAARDKLADTPYALEPIGDNLTARMPLVRSIIDSKVVSGALTSVLGGDHYRYSHAFIHKSGPADQGFHKDAHYPWGLRAGIRSHRPNWAMLFYYPQRTTVELGATHIVPGTTYWNVDHEIEGHPFGEDRLEFAFERERIGAHDDLDYRDRRLNDAVASLDPVLQILPVEIPKGAVVLVHFDLFHRGARSMSADDRFMFKFWYVRMREPRRRDRIERLASADPRRQAPVIAMGNWLTGHQQAIETDTTTWETNEAGRVARAYQLGSERPEALIDALRGTPETPRRAAMYGLTCAGGAAHPAALEALADDYWGIRKSAAFLLGEIGLYDADVVTALAGVAATDAKSEVRSTAVTALARIVRRDVATGQARAIDGALAVGLARLDPSVEPDMPRSLVPMNRVRQAAALLILTIVTEALDLDDRPAALTGLAETIAARLANETDRYAAGTLTEIVNRLALAGDRCALTIVVAEFSRTRWTPTPRRTEAQR